MTVLAAAAGGGLGASDNDAAAVPLPGGLYVVNSVETVTVAPPA